LITIKQFLLKKQDAGVCQIYKFIGDGWVLYFHQAFPEELSPTVLVKLAENVRERSTNTPKTTENPAVLADIGIDKGQLIELVMSNHKEYIGRALK